MSWSIEPEVEVISEPGGYGDGPIYIRIHRERAGKAWPARHEGTIFRVEYHDTRCRDDDTHVYIRADNSHNAFIYQSWLREDGIPKEAMTVVRLLGQPGLL